MSNSVTKFLFNAIQGTLDLVSVFSPPNGTVTLVAGTVVVPCTTVTANSEIFLTGQNTGGTAGELSISARSAGVSFTILSTSNTDTRTIAWLLYEPVVAVAGGKFIPVFFNLIPQ